jgi:hypothetical protein
MSQFRGFFTILILAGVPLLAACASNSTPGKTSNGASTDGGDSGDAASCDGVPENVLPVGSCSMGVGPCSVLIPLPANCTGCNSSEYSCSCSAGVWKCDVVGAGLCMPVCDDGGAD